MARTATSSHYTYLDCPACKQGIAEPFVRSGLPFPFVHGHGRNRCRIMVWTDAVGTNHRAWQIPRNVSLEEAAEVAVQAAYDGGWALVRRSRLVLASL